MRPLLLGPYAPRAARRATAVALFFQWFIVITGATVRLTGSGLGCPNWPTCTTTRAVPELEQHALIEFLNRMTTTPTLLTAIAALWICWRLVGAARRDLRIATSLVVGGVFVQAGLGALTVILELPPEIVAVHFLVSIGLLAAATFAWCAATSDAPLRLTRRAGRGAALVAVAMLTLLLAIIVAGVATTASGPHSGAAGTGQTVDRFQLFDLAIMLHARGAYLFLALIVVLTLWRRQRGAALRDLSLLLLLVAGQITLGEVQYRTGLPWGIVLAHVVNAALLWILATRIAVDAAFEPRARDLLADADPAVPQGDVHPLVSTP
ncbi:MAG: cytochrome oxidase assembly [Thermoleophilia bacterium]|nr:cytochrome oxidase assembly [Thermoleophilia bacterium]MCZ4497351.1 cytochrome oxidase assembly [Thermoleophilia bacterium]